ncbi:MAG: hypothetical protein IJV05_01515 [Muribaculaceae bacterium]|nr:hypothetical protein [Muribaculaceae bacterium]
MFSINEHIEYLLTCNDCVVVPAWGAFIANYKSACYDDGREVMECPRRTVSFNAGVSHNDGLLAQSLMRREGMTYEQAMSFIADSVTTFRQQLAMDCEVSMGRLGYFRRNDGRYIEFVPFYRDNASDQYYGLTDLDVKTVVALEQELADAEAAQQEPAVAIVPKERNLFSRKATQVAASIAVLIGLGVVLSTPIIVDRQHNTASMLPEVTAPQAQQLAPTVQEGVVSQGITSVNPYPGIAEAGNTAGKYYMVIATLRNQQELDAFKAANASLVPYMKMLDYKGLMCVYVARSDDYGKLMSLSSELPDGLRDIWLYY